MSARRRQQLARCTARFAFRSDRSSASLLQAFASAERNSELELLAAARLTSSAEHRALYLRHALDESRHADAFFKRAAALSPTPMAFRACQRTKYPKEEHALRANREASWHGAFPDVDVDDLFARLGERDFLAFVHLGERRGAAQFRGYIEAFGQDERARLFVGILVDEDRHEATSWSMLLALCDGDEARARRRVRAMAAWEAWRRWRRLGRTMAGAVYVVAMTVLFFLCAPLSAWLRLSRPEPRGWQRGLPP